MRTTINIDDELLLEAQKITHIKEKTAVVHARLLAERGGSDPTATAGPRRRSAPPPE